MKVLVTGAEGFIGRHLCRYLASEGRAVVALDIRGGENQQTEGIVPVQGDILDKEVLRQSLSGVHTVFHLASAHLDVSLEDAHYEQVNVEGTRTLVREAKAAGVSRFVHCSSVAVTGDVRAGVADETTPANPAGIYGRTKLAGEQIAIEEGEKLDLPVVVVRPAWVYGPGCPRTAKLFRAVERRKFVLVGGGHNLRHPVYVTDMTRALELAAERGRPGTVYIVAGDKAVTVAQLARAVAAALDVSAPKRSVPVLPMRILVTVIEMACRVVGKRPPVSRRSLEFFETNNQYSIERAQKELGFVPEVSLAEGMALTRESLRLAT